MTNLRKVLENLVRFFLPLGLLFQILGYGGRLYWVLDIFSHAQGQFFLLGIFSIFSSVFLKDLKIFLLSVVSLVLSVFSLAPLYTSPQPFSDVGQEFTVLSLNVLTSNTEYEQVAQYLQVAQPDVILLVEVNEEWVKALEPSLTTYSNRYLMPRPDNFGMALFSKYPLEEAKRRFFGEASTPAVTARIKAPQGDISFYGVHTYPPVSIKGTLNRDSLLRALFSEAKEDSSPKILAGDLNTSRWGMILRELLPLDVFRDSAEGFGYHATWFARDGFLGIPIDMILVSPSFTVERFEVGPAVGSDHRGVMARLRLAR